MNLKEAFRYQNKLQSFLDEAQSILDRDANITKVENTYLRRKVMAEAEDEIVAAVPETEYYEQITDIARFLLHVLDEKETLSAAIRTAKDALDIDMDSEVSLNAARQSVARTFRHMNVNILCFIKIRCNMIILCCGTYKTDCRFSGFFHNITQTAG